MAQRIVRVVGRKVSKHGENSEGLKTDLNELVEDTGMINTKTKGKISIVIIEIVLYIFNQALHLRSLVPLDCVHQCFIVTKDKIMCHL